MVKRIIKCSTFTLNPIENYNHAESARITGRFSVAYLGACHFCSVAEGIFRKEKTFEQPLAFISDLR